MNERFNYVIVRLVSSFLSSPLKEQIHKNLLASITFPEFLYNNLIASHKI